MIIASLNETFVTVRDLHHVRGLEKLSTATCRKRR